MTSVITPASPSVFRGSFSISATGPFSNTTPIWTNAPIGGALESIEGYKAISIQIISNPNGATLTMQDTLDTAGAIAGTATWLPNSSMQTPSGNAFPAASSVSGGNILRWNRYSPAMRLIVTGATGAGTITVLVSYSGTDNNMNVQQYPGQSWNNRSIANPNSGQQVVTNVALRQMQLFCNSSTDASQIWISPGSAQTGAGAILLSQGDRLIFGLPGPVNNQAWYVTPANGATSNCNITYYDF